MTPKDATYWRDVLAKCERAERDGWDAYDACDARTALPEAARVVVALCEWMGNPDAMRAYTYRPLDMLKAIAAGKGPGEEG